MSITNYASELEVQGAVKAFITKNESDEGFEYQNIRQNAIMGVYADLSSEARQIISAFKTHMAETERQAIRELGVTGYIEELDEVSSSSLSDDEVLAQEIETQSAVKNYFKRGDIRLYRFLGKDDFFKAYAMISENARRILSKERKQSIVREQTSEQFFGNGTEMSFESRIPTSPSIEVETAESVDYFMENSDCNYKVLSEDEFFKEYAKNSYDARKEAVERRRIAATLAEQADTSTELTAADLVSVGTPPTAEQPETKQRFL